KPRMVRSVTPLCQSQTRMVLSSEDETICSPSGVKARSLTRAVWPPASRSRRKSAPFSACAEAAPNSASAPSQRRQCVAMRLSQPPMPPSEPEQRRGRALADVSLDRQGIGGRAGLALPVDIAGEIAPERDGIVAEIGVRHLARAQAALDAERQPVEEVDDAVVVGAELLQRLGAAGGGHRLDADALAIDGL